MVDALHLAVAHIQIKTGDEFSVAAACNQVGLIDQYWLWQGVMCVPCQNDIDAINICSQFTVNVKAVMRQKHDKFGAFAADFGDQFGHVILAHAKA